MDNRKVNTNGGVFLEALAYRHGVGIEYVQRTIQNKLKSLNPEDYQTKVIAVLQEKLTEPETTSAKIFHVCTLNMFSTIKDVKNDTRKDLLNKLKEDERAGHVISITGIPHNLLGLMDSVGNDDLKSMKFKLLQSLFGFSAKNDQEAAFIVEKSKDYLRKTVAITQAQEQENGIALSTTKRRPSQNNE